MVRATAIEKGTNRETEMYEYHGRRESRSMINLRASLRGRRTGRISWIFVCSEEIEIIEMLLMNQYCTRLRPTFFQ